MANVPITAGSGTVISTDVVTADSSNIQNIQPAKVVAGVLTRTPLPLLGTAGTPSADVVSVQGVASGTPVPISAASLPLPAGAATAANQPPLGAALSAASLPVVLATDGVTIGALTETAPGTDTASSGLNGRLQRIAQRLTTIIGVLPAALGGGGGLKVEGVGTAGTPAGGVVTVQGQYNYGSVANVGNGLGVGGLNGAGQLEPINVDAYSTSDANPTSPIIQRVAAESLVLGAGLIWQRLRTPAVFKSLAAVAVNAETTVWIPATGKKFRLMGYAITQTGATGNIVVKDNTAGTTILVIPANTLGVVQISGPMGNGILSAAANNVLTFTGVASEVVSGYVFGTEE